MLQKLLSRKLLVTLFMPGFVLWLQGKGVPQETIEWIVGLAAAYVGGQAFVDAAGIRATIAANPPPAVPRMSSTTIKPGSIGQ